jgi:hypothetical protein
VVHDNPRIVEVAHEALLRKWPRLRAWLDEAREFLIGKQQLENDLSDWESASEADKSAALLTGLKLSRMRAWLAERPQQLTPEMRAFGQASIEQAEAEQKRQQRQRRIITRVSIAAAVVLACFAGFALYQWRAARKALDRLSLEMVRYSWIDMGHKQEENALLTDLAQKSGKELFDVLPKSAAKPGDTPYLASGDFNCHTWLTDGFRYLYCSLHDVIGLEKLQSITRQSVFLPGGPHGNELNLDDKRSFGHYNPAFLSWVDRYVIPEATDDPRSKALIRLAYASQVGPAARALYHTHQILFAGPEGFRSFLDQYKAAGQRYMATNPKVAYLNPRATRAPRELSEIKDEYQKSLASGTPTDLGEAFRWLSDYATVVDKDDWYLANTAGGFWARRSLDGTEPQIFELVKKVLQTYEPEVLSSTTDRASSSPGN